MEEPMNSTRLPTRLVTYVSQHIFGLEGVRLDVVIVPQEGRNPGWYDLELCPTSRVVAPVNVII